MVDLIKCFLPVSRNSAEIVADPVLEKYGAEDKVVEIGEIYKLVIVVVIVRPCLAITCQISFVKIFLDIHIFHLGHTPTFSKPILLYLSLFMETTLPTISEIFVGGSSTILMVLNLNSNLTKVMSKTKCTHCGSLLQQSDTGLASASIWISRMQQ